MTFNIEVQAFCFSQNNKPNSCTMQKCKYNKGFYFFPHYALVNNYLICLDQTFTLIPQLVHRWPSSFCDLT